MITFFIVLRSTHSFIPKAITIYINICAYIYTQRNVWNDSHLMLMMVISRWLAWVIVLYFKLFNIS